MFKQYSLAIEGKSTSQMQKIGTHTMISRRSLQVSRMVFIRKMASQANVLTSVTGNVEAHDALHKELDLQAPSISRNKTFKSYIESFRSGVTDVNIDVKINDSIQQQIAALSAKERSLRPVYFITERQYYQKIEKLRNAEYICRSMEECEFLNMEVTPDVKLVEIPKLIEYCLHRDKNLKNVLLFWELLIGDNVIRKYYSSYGEGAHSRVYLEEMLSFCEKIFELKSFTQSMRVFKYIYEEYLQNKIPCNSKFLSTYLRIRTGTEIEFAWKELNLFEHNFKKYQLNETFLQQDVSKVINYIQNEVLNDSGSWKLERNSELESNIIYFIAIHQPEMLESYLDFVFFNPAKESVIKPDTSILISILNSYFHLQDISKGLSTMNKIFEKYGYDNLDLSIKFWTQLFVIGNKGKKHEIDEDLTISINVWELLKKRSLTMTTGREQQTQQHKKEISCLSCVPFFQILKDSKTENNIGYKYINEIFEFFIKDCILKKNIDSSLRTEEREFMKSVFKALIKMKLYKNFDKSIEMIEKYDFGYKDELINVLIQRRLKEKNFTDRLKTKKKLQQRNGKSTQTDNEDIEMEDKLLGGDLW